MSQIFYVHGAGGSAHSFLWLRQQLPAHEATFFSYQPDDSVRACISRLSGAVARQPGPVILVGHSLGGIIARGCALERANVSALVTLCAPFGGMAQADMLACFSNAPMFRELHSYGSLLRQLRDGRIAAPHRAIIGCHGLPFTYEANDGVVTVASQTALAGPSYASFRLNHFEVLLSPDVAANIAGFLGRPA